MVKAKVMVPKLCPPLEELGESAIHLGASCIPRLYAQNLGTRLLHDHKTAIQSVETVLHQFIGQF